MRPVTQLVTTKHQPTFIQINKQVYTFRAPNNLFFSKQEEMTVFRKYTPTSTDNPAWRQTVNTFKNKFFPWSNWFSLIAVSFDSSRSETARGCMKEEQQQINHLFCSRTSSLQLTLTTRLDHPRGMARLFHICCWWQRNHPQAWYPHAVIDRRGPGGHQKLIRQQHRRILNWEEAQFYIVDQWLQKKSWNLFKKKQTVYSLLVSWSCWFHASSIFKHSKP